MNIEHCSRAYRLYDIREIYFIHIHLGTLFHGLKEVYIHHIWANVLTMASLCNR